MMRRIIVARPLRARPSEAARRRDSESTRKLARVTTASPGREPLEHLGALAVAGADLHLAAAGACPRRATTKTTLRVPESTIASVGMLESLPGRRRAASPRRTSPGRSSPVGLGKASRTFAVRVFGSRMGSMK